MTIYVADINDQLFEICKTRPNASISFNVNCTENQIITLNIPFAFQ